MNLRAGLALGIGYYQRRSRWLVVLGELAFLGLSFTICKMGRGGVTNLPTFLKKTILSNQ